MDAQTISEHDGIYHAWKAAYEFRKERLLYIVTCALTTGKTVVESWESISGEHVAKWALGTNHFIAPFKNDPVYLAKHLISRHFGFGWTLTVDGISYEMGNEA